MVPPHSKPTPAKAVKGFLGLALPFSALGLALGRAEPGHLERNAPDILRNPAVPGRPSTRHIIMAEDVFPVPCNRLGVRGKPLRLREA